MSKKKEKNPVQEAAAPKEVLEEQAGEAEAVELEAGPQANAPGEEPEAVPEEAPAQEQLVPKEQFLRLAAEYDNYRKRTAKEKETLYQDAKIDTIREFLAVYDNLERAAAAPGDEDSPHKKGLEMIFHQLRDLLKKMGAEEIEAQGQPFDPEKHEAVMHIDDENLGENVVAQVFQAGFQLDGRVIRHAIVQVAN